jgi:hypothetical protein
MRLRCLGRILLKADGGHIWIEGKELEMDPRQQAPVHHHNPEARFKLMTVELVPIPLPPGYPPTNEPPEVAIFADSVVYSLSAAGDRPFLIVGSPEGAQVVKRRFWKIEVGQEIPPGALQAHSMGHVVIEAQTAVGGQVATVAGSARLVAVFLETQEQAVQRARSRQRPR